MIFCQWSAIEDGSLEFRHLTITVGTYQSTTLAENQSITELRP